MSLFSWARAGMDAVDDDDDEEEEGGKHPDGMSAPSSPGVDWSLPPEGEEGGPIAVSVCLEAHHVTAVDTVKATAVIKCGVVLYWRDRRLSEMWSSGDDGACRAGRFTLPGKLWGPRLRLHNALDVRVDQVFFDLVRPAEGLLRRMLVYTGTIINSMDLRDFPFDIDEVEVVRSPARCAEATAAAAATEARGCACAEAPSSRASRARRTGALPHVI